MSTAMYSPNYGTDPYGGNLDWGTSDPRKIASQQRRQSASQYSADTAAAGKTQDYLGGILDPLARGEGGYNSEEKSQIQLTPQQQQDIVTGAGISAGTGTAAAVGGAQRAANAAGGNPLALAAYRARAARSEASDAGDAMTKARIAASDTAAQRAQAIGGARLGQQNTGLNYYQGLQAQQNQNAQNDLNREVQGSQLGVQASQTPSTFDKIMGGVSGALSFLDEGGVSGRPAVVGENGPEKIVDLAAGRDHMDEGGVPSLFVPHTDSYNAAMSAGPDMGTTTTNPDGSLTFSAPGSSQPKMSFWKKLQAGMQNNRGSGGAGPSLPSSSAQQRPWSPVDTYSGIGQNVGKFASYLEDGGVSDVFKRYVLDPPRPAVTPNDDYPGTPLYRVQHALEGHLSPLVSAAIPTVRHAIDQYRDAGAPQRPAAPKAPTYGDGGVQGANGIFTKPTKVTLGHDEAVVPLNYRARAKTRPSLANLPAARNSGERHSAHA